MSVIRVAGVADFEGVEIAGDAHVPLMATWQSKYTVRPVYYRRAGPAGGSLELQLDPFTGRLLGLVIVTLPSAEYVADWLEPHPAVEGLPIFDLSPWDLNPDRQPTKQVVKEPGRLSTEPAKDGILIRLEDLAAQRWVAAGPISFGLASDGSLVSVFVGGTQGRQLREATWGR